MHAMHAYNGTCPIHSMKNIPQTEKRSGHLLQVRIPTESWEKVRIAAAMRGLSTTALVSKILGDFIMANDVPAPVSKKDDFVPAC